ncbi:MAG TPA: hypothetical protein VMW38_12385 [Terriglobia bacterium]|nr:hypothetical protein [Terriglobia bacterium]
MKIQLLDVLINSQNPDGGWGYSSGKRSALEPSAYAFLALRSSASQSNAFMRALQFLRDRQLECGGWPVNTVSLEPEAWVTALVGMALHSVEGFSQACKRSAEYVLRSFARMQIDWITRLRDWIGLQHQLNVDPHLGGWGWTTQTAKWLEPTCMALIFLNRVKTKMNSPHLDDVLSESEQMTYSRMCRGGGWNYGNVQVLGEQLRPFALTTALALIALQHHASSPANQQSLDYLLASVTHEKSALTLCFSCLCLDLYSRRWEELQAQTRNLFTETNFFGDLKIVALALLVLEAGEGQNPFRYASA